MTIREWGKPHSFFIFQSKNKGFLINLLNININNYY